MRETGEMAGKGTRKMAALRTGVTSAKRTRSYKPRARKCGCCGTVFTPKSKHGAYCSERCRKKAWRARQAKRRQKQPNPAPVRPLEVVCCAICGTSFFGVAGKHQRYCTPSCRNTAWRLRRAAVVEILTFELGISSDKAADIVESGGMKKVTDYLQARGYQYCEREKAWQMMESAMRLAG